MWAKKCLKCGKTGTYKPRQQRCREVVTKFGGKKYWCYGQLQTVVTVPKPRKSPQDIAKKKLQDTEVQIRFTNEMVMKLARRLGQLSRRSKQLAAKAARLSAAASLTDADVEAARQRRIAQQQQREAAKRTRKIDLEE